MADALEYIGLGTVDNDGSGDSLKTAGEKVNRHIRRTIGRNIPKSADFNLLAENCNDFIICDTTSADITVTFKLEDETDYLYPDNSTLRLINIGINDLILDGEIVGEDEVTITGNFVIKKYCVVDVRYLGDNEWIVDNSSVNPSKAAASDINTGTDDDKYVTSKAIADSNVATIYDVIAGIRPEDNDFTLSASYINHLHRVNKATAVTITFPKNAVVAIPVNSVYPFEQTGAGILTLAPVDEDVTLNSNGGALKSWGQYSVIYAIKVDTNVWTIYGGSV